MAAKCVFPCCRVTLVMRRQSPRRSVIASANCSATTRMCRRATWRSVELDVNDTEASREVDTAAVGAPTQIDGGVVAVLAEAEASESVGKVMASKETVVNAGDEVDSGMVLATVRRPLPPPQPTRRKALDTRARQTQRTRWQ